MSNKNISLFLDGKLKGKELEIFYKEIASNPELMEGLSEEIINTHGRLELKQLLNDIKSETQKSKRTYTLTSSKILKLAASLIILFSIAMIIRMIMNNTPPVENENAVVNSTIDSLPIPNNNDYETKPNEMNAQRIHNAENKVDFTNETKAEKDVFAYEEAKKTNPGTHAGYEEKISTGELVEQYYKPYESPVYRADEENVLDDAIELYKKGRYEMSFQKIQQTLKNLKKEEDINLALFYQGLCLLHDALQGSDNKIYHLNSAKKNFYAVYVTGQQGRPYEEAGWYLSLTYLALEEKKGATDVLRKIARNKSYNYKHAEALLEKITNGKN